MLCCTLFTVSLTRSSFPCLSCSFSSLFHQFSSVAQSCPTLCDPMNRSTPGLPAHHQLSEFTQTHAHWVSDAIQPSYPLLSPFSSCPQSFPASGSFPMSWLFASGGQSIGASASASVFPMNIQGCRIDWFDLLAVQETLYILLAVLELLLFIAFVMESE